MIRFMNALLRCCCLLILLFSACEDNTSVPQPASRGDRHLGLHLTFPENGDYGGAFALGRSIGMSVAPLTLHWSDLEPHPGQYTDSIPLIMNLFFPAQGIPVALELSPIQALDRALPSDLHDRSFSDPEVIQRFRALLDRLHTQAPEVEYFNLVFGNEIDLYLNAHPTEWPDYQVFYDSARLYAKQLWGPELPVGVEATFGSLTGAARSQLQELNTHSDHIAFSFYPLQSDFSVRDPSVFGTEMDKVLDLYPDRLLSIDETGYQTSELCNSSEARQAEYITEVFRWWDEHAEQVPYLAFLWLTDLSSADTENFVQLYGLAGQPGAALFAEYLRTLGLRTYAEDGADKEGFRRLSAELEKRNW